MPGGWVFWPGHLRCGNGRVLIVRKILAAALYYIAGVISLLEDMRIMAQASEEFDPPSEVKSGTVPDDFTVLVRTHINWVYAMARRQLGNATLAQDAAQSVFLTLWRHRRRVATGGNTAGWLARTTWRACNDLRKSESRRKTREYKVALQRAENDKPGDESATDSQRFAELDAAMQRLKASDQTVLAARFFQALSVPEVAEQLGISQAAAEKRISRAIDRLRKVLIGQRTRTATHSGAVVALLAVSAPEAPAGVVRQVLQCVGPNMAPAHIAAMARRLSPHVIRAPVAVGTAVMLAAALAAAPVLLQAHQPAKLIISRATTYITSPLGKDGLPDYKLALKQYLMKGITPKNNAAVPAIEIAMQGFHEWGGGPEIHYRKMGADQLKLLGVTPPGKAVPKFDFISQFFKVHPPQGYKLPSSEVIGMSGPAYLLWGRIEQGFALDFPWRRSQCFLLSTAMQQNKAATEFMRKASLLPRFYLPFAWNPKRFKPPIAWFFPLEYVTVEAGDCLAYNATLALGSGHPKMCWSDERAVYRLAKLAYQQPGFGTRMGDALLDRFLYVARVLLGQLRGHPRRLARIWKMIHTIPLPPLLGQRYIHVCRLDTLKLLLSCYRHQKVPPMQPLVRTLSKQVTPKDIVEHPPADINWGWQCSHINATFDQMRAMAPATAYSAAGKRLRALEYRWSRAENYIGVLGGWNPGTVGDIPRSLNGLLAKNLPLNVRYHNMVILATGAIDGFSDDQTQRSLVLVKIAYAVEMYRNAHGHYPGKLAALVPAYFKQLPVDPKTGKFAIYVHRGDGYAVTFREWTLHSRWAPFLPTVGEGGGLCALSCPHPHQPAGRRGRFRNALPNLWQFAISRAKKWLIAFLFLFALAVARLGGTKTGDDIRAMAGYSPPVPLSIRQAHRHLN